MKQNTLLFILLVTIALACTNTEKPKVVYAQDSTAKGLIVDTAAVTMVNLPIHFDSTNYSLFVVGKTHSYKRGSKFYIGSGSSSSSNESFSVGYFNGESVRGDMNNLKFQHIDSTHIRTLTTEQINIRSLHLVHAITNVILLEVVDKDTNKDYQLTSEDVGSFYIANASGSKFVKLSPNGHQLLDWRLISAANRVYYRTIEDANKNGKFDKKDIFHHYFVSLKNDAFEAIEIFPSQNK